MSWPKWTQLQLRHLWLSSRWPFGNRSLWAWALPCYLYLHLIVSQALMWLSSDGESDVKGAGDYSRGFCHSFSAGHHCGICKAWSAMQRPIQEPESHWNDHVLQCNCSCLQQQPAEGRQGLANGHVDRVALPVAKTVGNWLSSLVSKWKTSKDVPGSSLGTTGFNYKEIPKKKKTSSPLTYHLGWQEYTCFSTESTAV